MSGSMGQEQAAGIARELLSRKGYLIEGDAARDGHTIVATKDGERVLAVVVGGGTLTAERARALAGEHGGTGAGCDRVDLIRVVGVGDAVRALHLVGVDRG